MTARTVPPDWRPAISRDGGRYRLAFRGRDIGSVVSEFTDVDTMLGQAAATGVDRVLLSPWISLVPAEADQATARDVCEVHNTALAALVAAHPGQVSAVGAVVLQEPELAARQIAGLVTSYGLAGAEIPASVGGRYLGDGVVGAHVERAVRAEQYLPGAGVADQVREQVVVVRDRVVVEPAQCGVRASGGPGPCLRPDGEGTPQPSPHHRQRAATVREHNSQPGMSLQHPGHGHVCGRDRSLHRVPH